MDTIRLSSKDILDLIKQRQAFLKKEFNRAQISADDWQEFKRKFVEEYGGEKMQDTGMTHSEFLQYLKDGTREGQSAESVALRSFLKGLDKI